MLAEAGLGGDAPVSHLVKRHRLVVRLVLQMGIDRPLDVGPDELSGVGARIVDPCLLSLKRIERCEAADQDDALNVHTLAKFALLMGQLTLIGH